MGCGNILLGDDGFGPAVVDYLNRHFNLPSYMAAWDVGTSVREVIFNLLLSQKRPKHIVLVDALDAGRPGGEVFIASANQISPQKIHDFSLHMMPTLNMLEEFTELSDCLVEIVAAQPAVLPEEVNEGLSPPMQSATREAAWYIFNKYGKEKV